MDEFLIYTNLQTSKRDGLRWHHGIVTSEITSGQHAGGETHCARFKSSPKGDFDSKELRVRLNRRWHDEGCWVPIAQHHGGSDSSSSTEE